MNKTSKSRNKAATAAASSATKKKEADSKNTPAFQNRKTIADYVRENMAQAGRKTFFQRVIVVCANLENLEFDDLKLKVNAIVEVCNQNLNNEVLTGIYIFYKNYSVLMVEGSEECVSRFLKGFSEIEGEFYSEEKLLLVQNNIRKVYFDNLHWLTENPPNTNIEMDKDADPEDVQKEQCDILIQKMHSLCGLLGKRSSMPNQIIDELPEIPRLDVVLKCSFLLKASQFADMYLKLTDATDNDEKVWPVPYDHLPYGIFSISKYDVNLTFSDPEQNK